MHYTGKTTQGARCQKKVYGPPRKMPKESTVLTVYPTNAEATFVQSTRTQIFFENGTF